MNIHHRNFLILATIGITIMAITVCMIVAERKTEQVIFNPIIGEGEEKNTVDYSDITADEIDASVIKWDDEKKMFYTIERKE